MTHWSPEDRALADRIAWEQVRHWRTFLTAQDVEGALGLSKRRRNGWTTVARRLAVMWLELQDMKSMSEAA